MMPLIILLTISAFISWCLIALAISQANDRNHREITGAALKLHNEAVRSALKLQNNAVTPFGKLKCKKASKKS